VTVGRLLSNMLLQPLRTRLAQDSKQKARRLVLFDSRERIDARTGAHKLVHEPARRAEARAVGHDWQYVSVPAELAGHRHARAVCVARAACVEQILRDAAFVEDEEWFSKHVKVYGVAWR
jgi:hypothetical protein